MADNHIKQYQKDDLTIVWNHTKCIHAAQCVQNARNVFRPKERPWVQLENGTKVEIIKAVAACPSGALSLKD